VAGTLAPQLGSPPGRDDSSVVVPEGIAPPADLPAQMFAAAADAYLAGQRLDMQSLARQLGVGRATLYRRVGNREALLDSVIWWRARRMLVDQLAATAHLAGAARIAAVIGGVLHTLDQDGPLRAFLELDQDAAMRILTGVRSQSAGGVARALERLIDLERSRGTFQADLESATLAYAIMRICEGFLYADVLADRATDISRAVTLIEALLTGLDAGGRP
jgi:AcrR family transcriptional regulator